MSAKALVPTEAAPEIPENWRHSVMIAYLVILVAFGGGAGWASVAKIASAAIAPGTIMAQSNKKTVQHLEGGIVREILVRNGDPVTEGQLLVRLDSTQPRATLDTFRNQRAVALVQEARLVAERDGAGIIILPVELKERVNDPVVSRALADQNASLRERATYLRSQVDTLNARIAQAEQEIKALRNDAQAARDQIATIDQELPGLKGLLAKQLVAVTRVTTLERERARLQGLQDRAVSDGAKAEQGISETKFQIEQIRQQFLQQVASDLIDIRKTLSDLNERENVARDVLSRVEVRAPKAGIVQGLAFFTIGAVVKPGDTILEIAPTGEELSVSVQIPPSEIDAVMEGLKAEIKLPTFHSRRVPRMFGKLRSVSYDRVADPQNPGNYYFQGEVTVDPETIPDEIRDSLKPGIQADVIITTGEQTPLDYLLGPLFDRVSHGLRER
ncbi:Type I secretion system membrane fusion protein PrsE [Methylobacterium jeotgali]|uniref:Membrane fusion protein (MFP) family protein n=4 Tax=Pseudomonadota TaxID=1224 RepID=A0ABQ4SS42_9HYPH|nr:Type I secretion system membrane fusion protein PrsE [Methylobacterium jeotgali]